MYVRYIFLRYTLNVVAKSVHHTSLLLCNFIYVVISNAGNRLCTTSCSLFDAGRTRTVRRNFFGDSRPEPKRLASSQSIQRREVNMSNLQYGKWHLLPECIYGHAYCCAGSQLPRLVRSTAKNRFCASHQLLRTSPVNCSAPQPA